MATPLRDLIRNPNTAELELIARYGMLPEDARRERAFSAFAAQGLPHRRLEGWRWSDVKAALPQVVRSPVPPRADPLAGDCLTFQFSPTSFRAPEQLPGTFRMIAQPHVQAVPSAEDVPMGALAAALSGGKSKPATLQFDITADTPERLHFVFAGAGEANFGRVIVRVRKGVKARVSESYLGGSGLTASFMEFTLEAGAQLERTVFQHGASGEVMASTALVELWGGAVYRQTTLAFGADLARLETRVAHSEPGASAMLNAAYLVSKGVTADITTHVRHGAEACITRQLTRGAVRAGGRGVFQGKFLVPRTTGQRTDANMQHQALLLEDGAEVFAKPELEIHADDVQCAHGNTSGALDPAQIFYARQRGLPEADARAMLTRAFIDTSLDEAGELADALRSAADGWFAS